MVIDLKVHLQTQVDPARSKEIRDGILLIKDGLDPGITSLVLYLHQVEHLQTQPGRFGKAQEVVRPLGSAFIVEQQKAESDIHPVVRIETVGITKYLVIPLQAVRKSGSYR